MGGVSSSFGGLGDAISGIASLGGSALGYAGTQDQIAAAQQNLATANAFSAQQYATRYQTTVKDLQAAGLNPMLAVTNGAGSAPSSAAPAPTFNKYSSLADAPAKAYSAMNMAMDTQQKDANVTNTYANTTATEAQAKVSDAQANLVRAQAISEIMRQPQIPQDLKNKIATEFLIQQQTRTSSAQESNIRNQTRLDTPDADLRTDDKGKPTTYGTIRSVGKDVISGLSSAAGAAATLKGKPTPTFNKYQTINNNYPLDQ
jgi:hypothetical protein